MTRQRKLCAGGVGLIWLVSVGSVHAQTQTAAERQELEEVVVTGFRQSLEDAALDKRAKTNFTDSIFAEDIGKFPDLNLAESLQRLPGIQIERDATGEGTRVNIRGLGPQFAILSMNGAQLQTASDNSVGFVNDGRGSSLDILPTELFRSLTISKTPLASQIEGGIAGNVEMRPIRPFDNPGFHLNYQLKGVYQDVMEEASPRGGVFASDTWDTGIGRLGVLAGVAYAGRSCLPFARMGRDSQLVTHDPGGREPRARRHPAAGRCRGARPRPVDRPSTMAPPAAASL